MNDNLDLGCTLIERAATDKAVRDIDKSLTAAYEERAAARAAGKAWVDVAALTSGAGRFPGSLPESLRPRQGGVAPQHLRVYEDFTRIPRTPPPPVPGVPGQPGAPGVGPAGASGPAPPPGVGPRPGYPGGSFQVGCGCGGRPHQGA